MALTVSIAPSDPAEDRTTPETPSAPPTDTSSTTPFVLPDVSVTFYSAQRIDVTINHHVLRLELGHHHITVKNAKGDAMTL